MRITCVIGTLGAGGAERVMTYLCEGLATRGHQVTLLTLDANVPDFYTVSNKVKRVKITLPTFKKAGFLQGIPRLKKLTQALKSTNPQVVISFMTLSILASCLLLKIPFIYADHLDIRWLTLSAKWRFLRDILLRYASAVTVLSNRDKDFILKEHPNWKAHVIYNPALPLVNQQEDNKADALTADKKWVISVGRLEIQKGFDRLLTIWASVKGKFPDWGLAIIGSGSKEQDLREKIAQLGLESSVKLLPSTTNIQAFYEKAKIYAMPSRTEGFPMVLLEAMGKELAVISFNCNGADVIIRNGKDGFLVEQDNLDLFADKMSELMQRESLRNELGQNAKEVLNRFTLDNYLDAYENLCKEAIGKQDC